jgi:hypothetical protein
MHLGIGLPTTADSWKIVRRAEALGVSHAWFYDTQMLCADVFVGMAVAAAHTSRIRLDTGVLIPSNRIAPVTANALASLDALAPGPYLPLHTGHFMRVRPEEERFLTADLLRDLTFTGTDAELRDRVRASA